MEFNKTRTEKLMWSAMKKHAGIPKKYCFVNYRRASGEPPQGKCGACAACIWCAYPLTTLPTRKVQAALYYVSILLRGGTGDAALLYVVGDTRWTARIFPSRS